VVTVVVLRGPYKWDIYINGVIAQLIGKVFAAVLRHTRVLLSGIMLVVV
jgi:hypothetical protein